MGLVQRLKDDVKAGWASVRYGTAQAANRALQETELLRLRLELRKLDDRIKDLCRDIGERAVELHERGEPVDQIMSDMELRRGAEQVLTLKAERAKLVAEINDVRRSE